MEKPSDKLCEFLTKAYQCEGPIVVAVGVHGPTSAMTAAMSGYAVMGSRSPWVVHVSGFGVAAARFLLPDTGQIGWDEYFWEIRNIANNVLQNYPHCILTADLDHGYGDARIAAEHIAQVIRLGVAGFNLEDQQYEWDPGDDIYQELSKLYGEEAAAYFLKAKTNPRFHWFKSCGHIGSSSVILPGRLGGGKIVLPLGHMLKKIEAVAAVRDQLAPEYGHVALNARTDIFSTYPMNAGEEAIQDAIRRGNAYLEAGADSVYYEAVPPFDGIDELASIQRLVRETEGPCTFNALRGGRTKERFNIRELEEMGVARVHLPTLSYQMYTQAMIAGFRQLWQTMDDSHIAALDFAATAKMVGWPEYLRSVLATPTLLHEVVKQGGEKEMQSLIEKFSE